MRVLLVGNYTLDAQPSMQRFARLLSEGLPAHGVSVEWVQPGVVVGRGYTARPGIGKWLGYVDKYIVFPPRLRRTTRRYRTEPVVVHVCDHSNAPYVRWLAHLPHVVTCHDLLAVRMARDEFPPMRTRYTGRRLQAAIVSGLRRARHIVCDSEATRADLRRIVGVTRGEPGLIPPGLSSVFRPLDRQAVRARLSALVGADWGDRAFILHVGGDQWYKNRAGLIDIYAALVSRDASAPPLVMAGQPLAPALVATIAARGLTSRVRSVLEPSDDDLAVLYNAAACLLFPSLAEGFGWPPLEAMACGCAVVVSNRAPLTETVGVAAAYIDPLDVDGAAGIVADTLREPDGARLARIAAGIRRAAAYHADAMVAAYVECYRRLLAPADRPEATAGRLEA